MDLLVAAVLVLGVMALVRALHPFPSKCSKPPRTLPGSDANPALATLRWEAVRRVAHEDVTAFGEQIANVPVPRVINSDENADFDQALGAYERAKEILGVASHPDDLQWVSSSLDDGRFALARLSARRAGVTIPSRRPPCFFDPRHGPSTGEQEWAPETGEMRPVPTCEACATRIRDGKRPRVREVQTASGSRPYFQAGPEFVPWVRGWYGASGSLLMHNMLMGTLLIDSLLLPSGYDYFDTDDEVEISVGHELGEYEYFDDESDFGFGSGVVDDYSGDLGSDFGGDLGGDYGGY